MKLATRSKLVVLVFAMLGAAQFVDAQIKLEDVSPGPGSTAGAGASLWGKMMAISATGLENAAGPPTYWSSTNDGVVVDHVGAADKNGHLVLFYSYPNSDWKAVDVSEKTNAAIAIVRPESWVFPDAQRVLERIAAPSASGDLLLFTWYSGSDWAVTNLTATSKKKIKGAVTSWQVPSGDRMVEHIGARGIDNHFLVFWRAAGGEWDWVDVTSLTGGQLAGDSGTSWAQNAGTEWLESVAMPDPAGDLILFRFLPSTNWQAQNISQLTSAKQKIGAAPAHWSAPAGPRMDYIAAPAPNGDLVVFFQDLIDRAWSVLNITNITGRRVVGPVANWNIESGGSSSEHLAGRATDDHLYVFSRQTGGTWQFQDVTDAANQTVTQPPAGWISKGGSDSRQNVAAPSWDGHLYVFSYQPSDGWTRADASLTAYGRIVYAAAETAGVWRSRDYGMNWEQLVRPQPADSAEAVDGLGVPSVLDVVASPADPNLVLAATDDDHRDPSLTGIYRSTDGGETWNLVHQFKCGNTVQPVTQIIFAPGDPTTLYAAGGCAIAVSHKRGERNSWTDAVIPESSAGARVWHIAMSEMLPGDFRRGYACGETRMWYSPDSAKNWHLDKGTAGNLPTGNGPQSFCSKTGYGGAFSGDAPRVLAIEPGRPDHVFLAVWYHTNGRGYFWPQGLGPDGLYSNVPVVYSSAATYQGEPLMWPAGKVPPPPGAPLKTDARFMFADTNSNQKLDPDEPVVLDLNGDGKYNLWNPKEGEPLLRGQAPAIGTQLTHDANIKYVDAGGPFTTIPSGDGSIWYGDYSSFDPKHPDQLKAHWEQLPGPPTYFGNSTTSGRAYVVAHATQAGYLVFLAGRESVHVSAGKPATAGWHRIDALDASASKRANKLWNTLLVHVDPHALTVSPDFTLALRPVTDQPYPYNQNTELVRPAAPTTARVPFKNPCHGKIWIANDGGIYRSDDCGEQWTAAQSGLSTLAAHNIAAVPQASGSPGRVNKRPALYFGTTDNDDFFSLDGGRTWRSANGNCGDCDVWYTDPADPSRVWRHPPRDDGGHAFVVFVGSSGAPDPTTTPITIDFPGLGWKMHPEAGEGGSAGYVMGSRPVVQTLAREAPLASGDYVLLAMSQSRRVLLRAKDTAGSASPLTQVGPDLPSTAFLFQASGGHSATVFYVGNGTNLWRWPRNDKMKINAWQQIVPSGSAVRATRFFVSPYESNVVYILDANTVRRSDTGGTTWADDLNLDTVLTAHQTFRRDCRDAVCVMNDMIFDRDSPKLRFALGIAGVFYTVDGVQWRRLLDTRAFPSRPRAAFFDAITDPKDRSLYIAFEGRGIMRAHPIPVKLP